MGTDIYYEVISYANQSHQIPNMSFILLDTKNISNLLDTYRGKYYLIYTSGSFQYMQPEHLRNFFDSINSYNNLKIIITEPASEKKGSPDNLKKSIYRANFAYTHDYRYYAEKAGIMTKKCKIIRPYHPYDKFPMHKYVVTYYYYGFTRHS